MRVGFLKIKGPGFRSPCLCNEWKQEYAASVRCCFRKTWDWFWDNPNQRDYD